MDTQYTDEEIREYFEDLELRLYVTSLISHISKVIFGQYPHKGLERNNIMAKEMKVTLFSKKQSRNDGRIFYKYLATLTRKDGTTFTCQVNFKGDDKNKPDVVKCPMNILVDRDTANLAKRALVDKDTGEVFDAYTLWVSDWKEGEPYIDHSLDDII